MLKYIRNLASLQAKVQHSNKNKIVLTVTKKIKNTSGIESVIYEGD